MSEDAQSLSTQKEPVSLQGESVTANEVTLTGAANQVNAQYVEFKDGGVFLVQSGELNLQDGGIAIASVQHAEINDGGAFILMADQVDLVNSNTGITIAGNVSGESVNSTILFARNVNGSVHTVLDAPRVLLAGAAFGVGLGLITALLKYIFSQDR